MSHTVDFILPDLGEGVHEAEIIAWKVKPGDTVDEMQVLAEMETDKALVEVPSPYAGKIVTLHGEVGTIAHVGKPIVTFSDAMQSGAPVAANSSAAEVPQAAASSDSTEKRKDAGTVVGSMDSQPTLGKGDGKVMATPAVRRLAKQLGVDINTVAGSGRGGRVTASDIENATGGGAATTTPSAPIRTSSPAASVSESATAGAKAAAASPPPPLATPIDSSGTIERIPMVGMRRKIAEALERSIRTAVHFTVMDTADVTALNRMRRQQAAASGEKVSFMPFIIQAVSRALRKFPRLNANVDDAKGEVLVKGAINMGIAVDTEHGLMVPVLANADRMGVLQLGRAVAEAAGKCRNRSIGIEELRGGTFTISNVGSYAGTYATPIINYPEVAILGTGRAKERVLARNGGIYIGMEMPLSISSDHRVIDGVYSAQMLGYIVELLENPEILLEPVGR